MDLEKYKVEVFDKIENQMTNQEENDFIHFLKQSTLKLRDKWISETHEKARKENESKNRTGFYREIDYLAKMNKELRNL